MRFGNGVSVCSQTFEMELDRFLDQLQHLVARLRSSDAAGQIWDKGAV